MPTYGGNAVADLFATQFNSTTIVPVIDDVFEEIRRLLAIHNGFIDEQIDAMVGMTTTERHVSYGGTFEMDMTELDENGTPDAQKGTTGFTLGLPLRLWGRSLQWNYTWFEEHSPRELGALFDALFLGDIKNVSLALRTAFFRPTNYTFNDHLVDKIDIAVKALINADSSTVPSLPDGTAVDGATHTHFLGSATFTAAIINSTITTVSEHFDTGQTVLWIPSASESAIRALTGANEFVPDTIPGVAYPSTTMTTTQALSTNQQYNRRIGLWGANGTPVFVKPVVPTNYILARQEGVDPPIVRRIRNAASAQLRMRFQGEIHPLGYEVFERKFGFGVKNRLAAAVARTNNITYALPALT